MAPAPDHYGRSVRARAAVVVAGLLVAAACSDDATTSDRRPATTEATPVASGFVDETWFRQRQDEFLAFATQELAPGSITNLIAHAERSRRDATFTFTPAAAPAADFAPIFERIDTLRDTTDFDLLYFVNLWYGYRDELDPELRDEIEARFRSFKYWFTEPTAPGLVDDRWYWSENHRIIYHTIEYLAGDAFPGDTFTNDGRTGAEHSDEAKQRILDWIAEKVRFGWSEWHSDVYYQKDVTPLLTLVEFAPDEEVAQQAAMLLDLLLLDVALHLHEGNFGATHGRSYMKDKSIATDQDTFAFAKLLFDDSELDYPSGGDAGAVLFARAQRYRMPEVIRRIASSDATIIDRERMGVPLDPQAEIDLDAPAPYGYDFDDPENVAFWWERGNQATWQGVALTLETLTKYGLWESEFFQPFVPLRDIVGGDPDVARPLARDLAPMLGFGLLTEVNSYTYRSPHVMLSTAQRTRPGMFADQHHAWQATLDEAAIVFTTHPKNEPEIGTEWPDGDGYWTGTGSMPYSVQHGTAAIHVYEPAFAAPGPGPLEAFDYLDSTHAYFPREVFDEVVTDGQWVYGRKGDGYVGLWSERPVEWRATPPGAFTHGLTEPFDLVAPGGAQNVWIVEVGDATGYDDFAAFQAALRASRPAVARDATTAVTWDSPSQGTLHWAIDGTLEVDGELVPIADYPRFDNPFVHADFETRRYEITDGDRSLVLDFDALTREAT
jgi:hypothetical protein